MSRTLRHQNRYLEAYYCGLITMRKADWQVEMMQRSILASIRSESARREQAKPGPAVSATKAADLTPYILRQSPNGVSAKYRLEWKLRKFGAICTFALLLGISSGGHAAEANKDKVFQPILPPVDLDGGFSVNLNTERPKQADIDAPPALTPLRDDSIKPFIGLKITKPLQSK